MAKITIKDVEYIAKLARLEYPDEEKQKFTEQFNTILAYINKLNELDTDNTEPLSHVIGLKNVTREDEVKPSLPVGEILQNAPAKTDTFFKVPKVIGDR